MSPLAETLLSILIVVIILIAICWLFGCFKKKNNQEPKEPISPEPAVPQSPLVEVTELPKMNYAPHIPSKTVNGREYKYESTSYWYKHTDGEYYQIIQSNAGGKFFVNKEGKRCYVTSKPIDNFVVFPEK